MLWKATIPAGLAPNLNAPRGYVIEQVSEEVDRSAEYGLGAVAVVRRVHTAISKHTDVVRAAIGLDEVVVGKVNVVVVDVDGRGAALGIGVGRSVCGDADSIVKIRDRVVGNDVPGP